MYLAISALGMTATALVSDRLGKKFISYTALFLGIIASSSLCILTLIGLGQEFFNLF